MNNYKQTGEEQKQRNLTFETRLYELDFHLEYVFDEQKHLHLIWCKYIIEKPLHWMKQPGKFHFVTTIGA